MHLFKRIVTLIKRTTICHCAPQR